MGVLLGSTLLNKDILLARSVRRAKAPGLMQLHVAIALQGNIPLQAAFA